MEQQQLFKKKIEELINVGGVKEADDVLNQYEHLFINDTWFVTTKSVIHLINGEVEFAVDVLLRGLNINPFNADILYNLAYLYEQKKDYQLAFEYYSDAESVIDDKEAVAVALKRLDSLVGSLVKRQKLVVFVKPGLDNFIDDIIENLSVEYRVRKVLVSSYDQIDQGMEWADICWFEWCDELTVYGSNRPDARSKIIYCRLHRYEAYSNTISKVNWENINRLIFVANHIRNYVLETYENINESQCAVVNNGIDLKKFDLVKKEKGFNIAYVGYLNFKKGPELLLQTFKAIHDKDPRYKLHIAGDFQGVTYKLYFDEMVEKLGLNENIYFHGWQDDINTYLHNMDYILSTSHTEGHPVGIMEAMAKGIKPIVHNYSGATEQFDKYVWYKISEAVENVIDENYNPNEYRNFIERNYSLANQVGTIKKLLELDNNTSAKLGNSNVKVLEKNHVDITNDEVKEYYDNFLGYLKNDRVRLNPRHEHIFRKFNEIIEPGQKVLDLGCGIGITTEFISNLNVSKVQGVDISPKLIEHARETVPNVNFVVEDITRINLNEEFDVITMCDVLEHIPKERYKALFETINKHLKKSGILYITIPSPEYNDFVRKYKPDALQIIDNSITYNEIYNLCKENSMNVNCFRVYGVFLENQYNEYIIKKGDSYKQNWFKTFC